MKAIRPVIRLALVVSLLSARPDIAQAAVPINWLDGPVTVQAIYTAMVFHQLEYALLGEFDFAGEEMFTQQISADKIFSDNEGIRSLWQRGLKNLLNGKFEERFGDTLSALPGAGTVRRNLTLRIALTLLQRKHPDIAVQARLPDGTGVVLPVNEFYMRVDGNLTIIGLGINLGTPRKLPNDS